MLIKLSELTVRTCPPTKVYQGYSLIGEVTRVYAPYNMDREFLNTDIINAQLNTTPDLTSPSSNPFDQFTNLTSPESLDTPTDPYQLFKNQNNINVPEK